MDATKREELKNAIPDKWKDEARRIANLLGRTKDEQAVAYDLILSLVQDACSDLATAIIRRSGVVGALNIMRGLQQDEQKN